MVGSKVNVVDFNSAALLAVPPSPPWVLLNTPALCPDTATIPQLLKVANLLQWLGQRDVCSLLKIFIFCTESFPPEIAKQAQKGWLRSWQAKEASSSSFFTIRGLQMTQRNCPCSYENRCFFKKEKHQQTSADPYGQEAKVALPCISVSKNVRL